MKSVLTMLNLMVFIALCFIFFVKSGAGEEMIKKAAKGAVAEIVKEEIKKQLPSLPSLPNIIPDKDWWKR